MSETEPLSFKMDGERIEQYGNIRRYPRTTPMKELVQDALLWIMQDVARVASDLGIPSYVALKTLQTYYVSGIDEPGGSHTDPLSTSWASRNYHTVYPEITVGWKFGVLWGKGAEAPDHENHLTEGKALG